MEDAGAKVSDIQARLGHSSLATTGRYLQALRRSQNTEADALAELFGLDG
jgi:integrase